MPSLFVDEITIAPDGSSSLVRTQELQLDAGPVLSEPFAAQTDRLDLRSDAACSVAVGMAPGAVASGVPVGPGSPTSIQLDRTTGWRAAALAIV